MKDIGLSGVVEMEISDCAMCRIGIGWWSDVL
jgi:hypothetical protein